MRPDPWLLCPADLHEAPPLAILGVLKAAICAADLALIADHPALLDSEPPKETLDRAAYAVISRLHGLHRAILDYRSVIERLHSSTPRW